MLTQGLVTATTLVNLLSIQAATRERAAAEEAAAQAAAAAEPSAPATEVGWLMREMRAYGARAVLLGPGQPPAFRCPGRSVLLDGPPLQEEQVRTMLLEAVPTDMMALLDERRWIEETIEIGGEPVRAVLYHSAIGTSAVLRPLELATSDPPPGLRELAGARSGLVLVTGPADGGAPGLFSALINEVAAARACHIVTVERPVETVVRDGKARVSRRQVGRDSKSFPLAAKSALRAKADVLALGALPDAATIAIALGAAAAGRLVIARMNTNGACETIRRIFDACDRSTTDALAGCLRGIVTQHAFAPTAKHKEVATAAEVLLCTPTIANLIRERRIEQIPGALTQSRAEGMCALDDSLARLARKGRITHEEALERALDPERLERTLNKREVVRASY